MKEIKCKHYDGDGYDYGYEIGEEQVLHLCAQCNLNLAGELMKQFAIEHFAGVMLENAIAKSKE